MTNVSFTSTFRATLFTIFNSWLDGPTDRPAIGYLLQSLGWVHTDTGTSPVPV